MSAENPFTAAKEAVAFQFLMHIDVPNMHPEEMTVANEVTLKRFRLGLYLQLLEPPYSPERDNCWNQVMTIADYFPKTVCQTLEEMISKTKEYLSPMLKEQRTKSGDWVDQSFNDTTDDLKTWSEKCIGEAHAMSDAFRRIGHHCTILRLSERLLRAYRDADDELKISLRTI